MAFELYDTTYGSVRLWCSRIESDNSRTQVIHELAEGDEHPTQDRGLKPGRPVTCEILWIEMPREAASPKDRFLAFKALVDGGDGPYLFVHPIDGAYYASVENFVYAFDEDGNVESCSVTFIRAAPAEAPIQSGPGTSIQTGADFVVDRAAILAEILDELELDPAVTADAVAAQDSWQAADEVPTRQVIVDVADLSTSIAALIEDNGLEDDLALWDAYVAAIMLGDAVHSAALAALSETPKLTAIYVGEQISLLALCVRLYGGADAQDKVRQIIALNDVRTPAWLPVGAIVMVPVPSANRRRLMAA